MLCHTAVWSDCNASYHCITGYRNCISCVICGSIYIQNCFCSFTQIFELNSYRFLSFCQGCTVRFFICFKSCNVVSIHGNTADTCILCSGTCDQETVNFLCMTVFCDYSCGNDVQTCHQIYFLIFDLTAAVFCGYDLIFICQFYCIADTISADLDFCFFIFCFQRKVHALNIFACGCHITLGVG